MKDFQDGKNKDKIRLRSSESKKKNIWTKILLNVHLGRLYLEMIVEEHLDRF